MNCHRLWPALVAAFLTGLAGVTTGVMAQSRDDAATLTQQVVKLFGAGRYSEATPLAERAVTLAERQHGSSHIVLATALSNLGAIYGAQNLHEKAAPLFERAKSIYDGALGADHPNAIATRNNLANAYIGLGRFTQAIPVMDEWVASLGRTQGVAHESYVAARKQLAFRLLQAADQELKAKHFDDTSKYALRAVDISATFPDGKGSLQLLALALVGKAAQAKDDPQGVDDTAHKIAELISEGAHLQDAGFAFFLAQIGEQYRRKGRRIGQILVDEAVDIYTKLGIADVDFAVALHSAAAFRRILGKYEDAAALYRRALPIYEKAVGPTHVSYAYALSDFANTLLDAGQLDEALPLLRRSNSIIEQQLGPNSPELVRGILTLSLVSGDNTEVEALLGRALTIERSAGGRTENYAEILDRLGSTARLREDYKKAVAYSEESVAIARSLPGQPFLSGYLHNLARTYIDLGRVADAEPIIMEAMRQDRAEYDRYQDELRLAISLSSTGGILESIGKFKDAFAVQSEAITLFRRQLPFVSDEDDRQGAVPSGRRGGYRFSFARTSAQLSNTAWALSRAEPSDGDRLAGETFVSAQQSSFSAASSALIKMASRHVEQQGGLAKLVRERQDLMKEWQVRERERTVALSQLPEMRDAAKEEQGARHLEAVRSRITQIDRAIATEFPKYSALVTPTPLQVPEVQDLLQAGEALILFLDTTDERKNEATYVWAITKTTSKWVRSSLGKSALKREVSALRCGLDYDGSWGQAPSQCQALLSANYSAGDHAGGKLLPFDLSRAHALYKGLFGEIEDQIRGKHLLVVPSGPLMQLPFQVLIKSDPRINRGDREAFRQSEWLIRDHAVTVLPSVFSLRALRQNAKESAANRPFFGVGNPLLDGPDRTFAKFARAARARTSCTDVGRPSGAMVSALRGRVEPLVLRAGIADVAHIRAQVPLPETADELCAVAADLGAGGDHVRLAARATETEIKRLSEAGELADYRVIHFATHGALAGQVKGSAEAGLLLTPPEQSSEVDDGYLSVSEIARLRLDADWVILSACNTAAGNSDGAEVLSGLASAFIYAGARSLLVSHWSVDSNATVKLITGAMDRIARGAAQSEAMRQSMLALIDKGVGQEAHPAYWAPFVVVGGGAITECRQCRREGIRQR